MILVLHVSDLNPMRLCIHSVELPIGNKSVRMVYNQQCAHVFLHRQGIATRHMTCARYAY